MAARITNADIMAAITGLAQRVEALEGKATVVAAPAKGKARTRKPAKPVTPEFIVTRAQNRDANRALAAALRAKGIEPNGAAWAWAKSYVADGNTVKQAAAQLARTR